MKVLISNVKPGRLFTVDRRRIAACMEEMDMGRGGE